MLNRFEVRKFFVGTNRTWSLSEQSADSSEEPTCRPRLTTFPYDIEIKSSSRFGNNLLTGVFQ